MKNIAFILLFSILTVTAQASEDVCRGYRSSQIAEVKQDFQNCLLDFPKENDNNVVMIDLTKEKIQCMQQLAYRIFEIFYASTRDVKAQQFDSFVKSALEQGYNLEQGSDIGKHWHISTFYEVGAVNSAYIMVHDLVKDYIHTMELECMEISDDALLEMKNR